MPTGWTESGSPANVASSGGGLDLTGGVIAADTLQQGSRDTFGIGDVNYGVIYGRARGTGASDYAAQFSAPTFGDVLRVRGDAVIECLGVILLPLLQSPLASDLELRARAGQSVTLEDSGSGWIVQVLDVAGVGRLGFFGGTPAARQTLTSATATPEQIALALEASTLMGGT